MAEQTEINWAEATHNQWIGCQETGSPACIGCYAREMMSVRYKRVEWGPHAERVPTADSNQRKPLSWNRNPAKLNPPPGTKPFIFSGSLMDFADNKAPPGEQEKLFATIRATPNLQHLMLTKRIGNVEKLAERVGGWPENAALLITVVTQEEADRDLPRLILAGARLRPTFLGVSMEPLAEPVDVAWALSRNPIEVAAGLLRRGHFAPGLETIRPVTWAIVGGGTDQGKHKAYPTDSDWMRDVRDQCRRAGPHVSFHLKQMTRKAPVPTDLQIQQRPEVRA